MINDFTGAIDNNSNIIIYGAGNNGQAIAIGLLESGIEKFSFLDKNRTGQIFGDHKIMDPDDIKGSDDASYIIGTGKYCKEAYGFLQKKNIPDHKIFTGIYLERLGNKKNNLGSFDYEGSVRKFFAAKIGEIYLSSMDLVITECCTLRCRDCSNLMQYYVHPVNCEGDSVVRSFQYLLDTVSFIGNVRILGGEPFVNQKLLIEILETYRNEDKIGKFVIVTNGTILPNNECIKIMAGNDKVKVAFSNYGEHSTCLEEGSVLLEANNISYIVITDNNEWLDYGEPRHYKDKSTKAYQLLYDECTSRRYCNTLFNGKFYLCPRAAHGERLGAIPMKEKDCIDFSEPDIKGIRKEKLMNLLERKQYILACEYCNWNAGNVVPKAEQTKVVLEL